MQLPQQASAVLWQRQPLNQQREGYGELGLPGGITSSSGPRAPGKGAQTPGESHWGSPVQTNYFTGNQTIIS